MIQYPKVSYDTPPSMDDGDSSNDRSRAAFNEKIRDLLLAVEAGRLSAEQARLAVYALFDRHYIPERSGR